MMRRYNRPLVALFVIGEIREVIDNPSNSPDGLRRAARYVQRRIDEADREAKR